MSESAGTPRTDAIVESTVEGSKYVHMTGLARTLERELADCQKEIWRREKQYRELESRLAAQGDAALVQDGLRLRWYLTGNRPEGHHEIAELCLREIAGDTPTLEEWRDAIDAAMSQQEGKDG